MQRRQGRWAYCTDARASISVPKEVKRGGFESHSSWVANRINLSAMCPQDADGHDVPGEVRRREEFVARGIWFKAQSSKQLTHLVPVGSKGRILLASANITPFFTA